MLPLTLCLHFKRDPKENIMLKPKKVLLTRPSVQRFILVMVSMRFTEPYLLKEGHEVQNLYVHFSHLESQHKLIGWKVAFF